MADSTTNIQNPVADAERLDVMVDQLVSEIDETIEAINRSRSDDDAPTPLRRASGDDASPEAADDTDEAIDDQVEELIADANTEAAEAEAEAVVEEPDAPEEDDLSFPVAGGGGIEDDADALDESVRQQSIDEIDRDLAAAADDELEGDFFAPEVTAPAPAVGGAAGKTEGTDEAPGAPPAARPAMDPAAMPSLVARRTAPAPEPVAEAAAARPRRGAALAVAGERTLRAAARPMALLPPSQRDTIGWFAINTLFLAACVWLYLMLRG